MKLENPTPFAALLFTLGLLALPLEARTEEQPEVQVEALGLTLRLPALEEFSGGLQDRGQQQGSWSGKLDGDQVRVTLMVLDKQEYGLVEPEQMSELIVDNYALRTNAPFFGPFQYHPGDFGFVPYATSLHGEFIEGTAPVAEKWILSGVLEKSCYAIEIDIFADADDAQTAVIEAFLRTGVDYEGPLRDPEWTEQEIEARLAADLPSSLEGERISEPLRTKHYIVFGNSSSGKSFGKKLEEYYEIIKDAFPFEDVEGQRLLPVFLFRTRDQYLDFVMKQTGWTREVAARSGGVASGDWYATTYQDPNDSVHIHELTHQIFRNRLLVDGGGSWFQEGVAVYVETLEYPQEEVGVELVGKRVGKDGIEKTTETGEFVPFRKFFTLPSILMSSQGTTSKGTSAAGQGYDQAGAIIRFVLRDKRTKKTAQEFLREVGSVRRSDLPAIERVIAKYYDVSIEEFEQWFAEYWKKPR